MQECSIIISMSSRRESALQMGRLIDFPRLPPLPTNTVNLSSVSWNATSSDVVSVDVPSDRVVVIVCTLITVILCSLARTLVIEGGRSDFLLLCRTSLMNETASALPSLGQ